MRLCFSTLPCGALSVPALISLCGRYGIPGIELRLDQENRFLGTDRLGDMADFGRAFFEAGIRVSDLGSSIRMTGYDPELIRAGRHCMEMARCVGAQGVRVFLGNVCRRYDAPRQPVDLEGICRALRTLCDHADTAIWIETHNEFATGTVLAELLCAVGRENLHIIWDLMHPFEDGETAEETWNCLRGQIAHVHIKDGKPNADPAWHDFVYTRLGEGQVPCAEAAELLKRADFQGFLSLEWENLWREELSAYPKDMDWILSEFIHFMKKLGVEETRD